MGNEVTVNSWADDYVTLRNREKKTGGAHLCRGNVLQGVCGFSQKQSRSQIALQVSDYQCILTLLSPLSIAFI